MIDKLKYLIEKIPGYSILAIAIKEINLIKTQKIALALILLYPLIVILTLGTAFSGSSSIGKVDVAFYVPHDIGGFDSEKFVEKLEKSPSIKLIRTESEADVGRLVMRRGAKVGIIVHEPEPTQGRYVVDVVSDNSNIVSSQFFLQAANDSVRSVGFETSRELLGNIWENLSKIKQDLKGETKKVDAFITQLDESENELTDLNKSVNSIDIAQMRAKLASQKQVIEEIDPKIKKFQASIDSFDSMRETNLAKIRQTRAKISDYKLRIRDFRQDAAKMNEYCEKPEAKQLALASPEVANACSKFKQIYTTLQSAETDLESSQNDLQTAENDLNSATTSLQSAKSDLEEIKGKVQNANSDLNYFNAQLSTLGKTVDKVNKLIDDSIKTKRKVKADLESSSKLMNGFISKLDNLQAISPQFLANPIIINKVSLFRVSKLEVITPIALVLVLMLTSILLTGVSFIVERTEGAYSRLVLSPTGKIRLFVGKILGQLMFSLVEAAIILAIAVLGFNVKIVGSLPELAGAICLVAISFICLGLFISNYTKIQSTTILAGLLLVIPMIFISGVIIPLELMSEPIQKISHFQPLSLGIMLLTEVLIKGTPLLSLSTDIATLAVPALIFLIFTIANKNL